MYLFLLGSTFPVKEEQNIAIDITDYKLYCGHGKIIIYGCHSFIRFLLLGQLTEPAKTSNPYTPSLLLVIHIKSYYQIIGGEK